MMMLEKNELQIAAFMAGWLQDNVEKGIAPDSPGFTNDGARLVPPSPLIPPVPLVGEAPI
jgi:hypothetical protein